MAVNVDAVTASYSRTYARSMLFGLYAQGLFDLCRKYLIMMGEPLFPTIVQTCTLPLHVAFNYILIVMNGWDVKGVGVATNLTFSLNFCLIFLAVCYVKATRRCLHSPNRNTFSKSWEYFTLGLPTALMTCMDIWAFSFLALIAHYLGIYENAGQVIMLNIISILYSIPLGFASGSCALVGR
mmetsp:Transcript_38285/g.36640  ORF Transcript_38285/g.36640 Transcript_38285/m.36640 type:complete len:182 (+) Transcript_38285:144-689(+)